MRDHHRTHVDALNPLEQHEHLLPADPSVPVLVAGHRSLEHFLLALGRSHSHHQAEVPIGVEELLAFELAAPVSVVAHEDLADVVEKHLVVDVGVPALGVVHLAVPGLLHVALKALSVPSVEASSSMVPMSMTMTMPVPMPVSMPMSSVPSESSSESSESTKHD